jgi:hypothetical protein
MAGNIEKNGGKASDLPPPPVSSNPDYIMVKVIFNSS